MTAFNHIDKPTALPGCCTFCSRPTDPNGFVDTGMELEYHGAIQVCYRCVCRMHDAFGFDATARQIINEDNVANVKSLVQAVEAFQEQCQDAFKNLNTYAAGLDRSFVLSYEALVQAAGAREAAIIEANQRVAEQARIDELGDNLDELGDSGPVRSGRRS